jgi:hypothetical protein
MDAAGAFAEGSVNARVVERLREIAELGLDDDEPEPAAAEPTAKPARKKAPKQPAAASPSV